MPVAFSQSCTTGLHEKNSRILLAHVDRVEQIDERIDKWLYVDRRMLRHGLHRCDDLDGGHPMRKAQFDGTSTARKHTLLQVRLLEKYPRRVQCATCCYSPQKNCHRPRPAVVRVSVQRRLNKVLLSVFIVTPTIS